MSNSSKTKLVEELRELVDSDNIDTIGVTYKTSGGPPGKQISQKVILSGSKSDMESISNDETKKSEQKRLLKIEPAERRSLFRQIALGLEDLISAEKAVFLPDSVITSLTIQVADKEFTTYFLANERDRVIQNKPIPSAIVNVVKHFESVAANE